MTVTIKIGQDAMWPGATSDQQAELGRRVARNYPQATVELVPGGGCHRVSAESRAAAINVVRWLQVEAACLALGC